MARPDFTVNDLVTWVRNKHTLKFGGEYRWLAENNRGNYNSYNSPAGYFTFASGETGLSGILSGSPVASFLLGQVDSGSATFFNVASNYPRAAAYLLHMGDTWKATQKLSINYGLRWDPPKKSMINSRCSILPGRTPEPETSPAVWSSPELGGDRRASADERLSRSGIKASRPAWASPTP